MIDLEHETIITLPEAARSAPGGPVHRSTIERWAFKGIRGVRLETALKGGRRVTSEEAVRRFHASTNSADARELANT